MFDFIRDLLTAEDHATPYVWAAVALAHAMIGAGPDDVRCAAGGGAVRRCDPRARNGRGRIHDLGNDAGRERRPAAGRASGLAVRLAGRGAGDGGAGPAPCLVHREGHRAVLPGHGRGSATDKGALMDPASAALLAEIIKAGVGYCLAAYFYIRLDGEVKDRRATEKVAVELMFKLKDEHHAARMGDHTQTSEVLRANARMIEAHTAQQAQLTAEVRELAQEVRRRPCVDGVK